MRIWWSSCPFDLLPGHAVGPRHSRFSNIRQRETKLRAAIHLSLRPDPATMPRNYAISGCQPNPGPRKLILRMQSLERLEKAVGILRIEPGAVVMHGEDRSRRFLGVGETDLRRGCLRRVLPRVAKHVLQHNMNQTLVRDRAGAFLHCDSHMSARIFRLQSGQD